MGLQYGIRAANYPLTDVDVGHLELPSVLEPYREKLFGLIISPSSPTTSGNEEVLEVITGMPHCIASRAGKPKPS